MNGFVYYIPGKTTSIKRADLIGAGLGYAFGCVRHEPTAVGVAAGPAGSGAGPGVVVADPRCVRTAMIGLYEHQQTWRRIPKSDMWVGYETDRPPGPDDLVRPDALRGHNVTLGDDRLWTVPVARGCSDTDGDIGFYNALPAASRVNDDGEWFRDGVVKRYVPLWDTACAWWSVWWEAVINADGGDDAVITLQFNFSGISNAALLALSTNYRVGLAEVDLLSLFTEQICQDVMCALVDWPFISALLKKKHAEADTESKPTPTPSGPQRGLDTSGGQRAGVAATAPVLAN